MIYDICMLLIVLYTTWRGSVKGVAWQLAAIGAMVLCFLFATPVSAILAPMIKLDPPLNRWIAMLTTYLVFSFICFAIARAIRSALEAAKFEEFDKHLGAAFGLVKGAAICFTITFFAVCLSKSAADTLLQTYTGHLSQVVMRNIEGVLPREIERVLEPYAGHLQGTELVQPGRGSRSANQLPNREEDDEAIRRRTGDLRSRDSYQPGDHFRGSRRPSQEDLGNGRRPASRTIDPDDSTSQTDSPGSLKELVNQLPGAVKQTIKDKVTDLVRDAVGPASRTERAGESPVKIQQLPNLTANRTAERKRLIADIAAVFYTQPDDLAAAEADTQAALDGVPDQLAIPALTDWHADLYGEEDPDPETELSTSLELRIVRQMKRLGISWDQLSPRVRQKLQAAQ